MNKNKHLLDPLIQETKQKIRFLEVEKITCDVSWDFENMLECERVFLKDLYRLKRMFSNYEFRKLFYLCQRLFKVGD